MISLETFKSRCLLPYEKLLRTCPKQVRIRLTAPVKVLVERYKKTKRPAAGQLKSRRAPVKPKPKPSKPPQSLPPSAANVRDTVKKKEKQTTKHRKPPRNRDKTSRVEFIETEEIDVDNFIDTNDLVDESFVLSVKEYCQRYHIERTNDLDPMDLCIGVRLVLPDLNWNGLLLQPRSD